MFFEIATAKEERKSGTVRGRSGPQIANARAEPESDRKTVEIPTNVGLRQVSGVSSFYKYSDKCGTFMKWQQEH